MSTGRPNPAAVSQLLKLATAPPGDRATDRELLELFVRDRSEAAFADLMARHGPMVLAVCRRHLRDWHAADDAFQATFLVLARKAGSIRWRESIGGWLFEVATRVSRKAAGQAARRDAREGASTSAEPAAPEPPVDLTALQAALDDELRKLPERFRVPLVLCHLEGLSQDEVARQLGVSDGQLRGRLYRARERLRERLTRRGFSLSAVLLALTVGTSAQAVPAALADAVRRFATASGPIPNAVHHLAQGVIREMTTTFKTVAVLTVLGVLALAAVGFAVRAATPDAPPPAPSPTPDQFAAAEQPEPTPKIPDAQPVKADDPKAPAPEISEDRTGTIESVDATKNKLVVDFDPHWPVGFRGVGVGITAETKFVFGRWPVKLSELKPGMRVHVIRYKDSKHPNAPDEVRASWPVIRPNVTGVNLVQMEITFEYAGEHGIALEVTLPLAPDTKPILDGARSTFYKSKIPLGKASWLSLSSDKKSVIDVTSFTGAYAISGKIASHDYKPRVMTVTTGPDKELTLPVADDAQIMVDGENARFVDVRNDMRVLIRTSADGKTITGIVAVSDRVALPEPNPKK